MTTDGPRWAAIEAALSEGQRNALLLLCRGLGLDPARWHTVPALRSVFRHIAWRRETEALLDSGAETGVHQARARAAIKFGLDAASPTRQGQRWQQKQVDKVS